MKRWRTVLARICWSLSALLVILGAIFTVSLVRHYGEAAGPMNLALQAALIWAPPAALCSLAGFLLYRSEKKDLNSGARGDISVGEKHQ